MTKEEENTVVKMIQYKTQRQLIGFHLTLIQIEGKQLEIWYPNYIEFHWTCRSVKDILILKNIM